MTKEKTRVACKDFLTQRTLSTQNFTAFLVAARDLLCVTLRTLRFEYYFAPSALYKKGG